MSFWVSKSEAITFGIVFWSRCTGCTSSALRCAQRLSPGVFDGAPQIEFGSDDARPMNPIGRCFEDSSGGSWLLSRFHEGFAFSLARMNDGEWYAVRDWRLFRAAATKKGVPPPFGWRCQTPHGHPDMGVCPAEVAESMLQALQRRGGMAPPIGERYIIQSSLYWQGWEAEYELWGGRPWLWKNDLMHDIVRQEPAVLQAWAEGQLQKRRVVFVGGCALRRLCHKLYIDRFIEIPRLHGNSEEFMRTYFYLEVVLREELRAAAKRASRSNGGLVILLSASQLSNALVERLFEEAQQAHACMIDIGSAFDVFLDEPSIDLHRRISDPSKLQRTRLQYRKPDQATVEKLVQLLPGKYPGSDSAAKVIQEWLLESDGGRDCLPKSQPCQYDYFTELLKHAMDSQKVAQYYTGKIYEAGLAGQPSNQALAAVWFERAARRGHESAALSLSDLLLRAVPKSCGSCTASRGQHALRWLLRSAAGGNLEAQVNLGQMKSQGSRRPLLPRDNTGAVFWFRRAARKGSPLALMNLGLMYHYGRGVPQDDRLAGKMFARASRAGDAGGSYHLGLLYYIGSGMPKNVQKAASLFKRAAESVHPGNERFAGLAALNLGMVLAEGLLGKEKVPKAKKWWRKAANYESFLPPEVQQQLQKLRSNGRL